MARTPRLIRTDVSESTVYHVMSRTALDGLPFGDIEKDELVRLIRWVSSIYAVDVHGFAIMGNHFHLLGEVHPASELDDVEVKRRFGILHENCKEFPEGAMEMYRSRFTDLSQYVKEIKQRFSCFYNQRHKRRGTLWGERFKSVMIEKGGTITNCLAYIDLNAVRAGIVSRPEDYRWCSMGYHVQTGNKEAFLSMDFGLASFGVAEKDRLKAYREFLYHVGSIEKKGKARIPEDVLEDAERRNYEFGPVQCLLLRSRYFTDSGAIGSKRFVEDVFSMFRERCRWKRVRVPKRVDGLDGVYSLRRFVTNIR